ncbi:hypothetical protein RJ639_033109 [Escallonia herrerae]|uniref:Sulfotransferase domain-containing protein n=1 Tax=Escallonia herrerae TaxID=1293975 RepID=A0AA88WUS3_9ASTE|nr:hypothetical protein RJ639_033109 [Escallonia herrerae]
MADKDSSALSSGIPTDQVLLDELPRVKFWDVWDICQWEGFWMDPGLVKPAVTFRSSFEAQDGDVLLASTNKTGTTWLKALCFCIMQKQFESEEGEDMLIKDNPHFHVQTIESMIYATKPHPDLYTRPSPRLFHTHLPFSVLPDSIKNSECKVVYIARNPKDTFVSLWHFFNSIFRPNQEPFPLEKAFDWFCNGVHPYGPFFDHVLQYWVESKEKPHKILFLKYEELKRDPREQVKRVASFIGRPFGNEEEADQVLWRCGIERLKNMEVNKDGSSVIFSVPNSSYFRRGVVGDWKNYLSPEMEGRLDEITRVKLEEFVEEGMIKTIQRPPVVADHKESPAANSSIFVDQAALKKLPRVHFWEAMDIVHWKGSWIDPGLVMGAVTFRSSFKAHDNDILLASTIKTGTTWLKALSLCIMQKQCRGTEEEDIVFKDNPHFHVQTIESMVYSTKSHPDLYNTPPPRLFHTHLPYSVLPDSIKHTDCKIVYVARNPKDTFVSLWHFFNSIFRPNQQPFSLEKAFDWFCNGIYPYGPFFDHILQYWEESKTKPHKILFLRYEELKKDPKGQVKRIASFVGRPFEKEEEADKVLWRCSLERLKNLEVNRNGSSFLRVPHSSYFRRGVVGGWKDYLTPELADRLDQITRMKLHGSGLDLEI